MLSPVEWHDGICLKRNDLSEFGGCFGGKAECVYDYITRSKIKKFVTCGSRDSLQCDIVSAMCENMGYECHIFIPLGKDTPTTEKIAERKFTTLHRIDKGYTVVIKSRSETFARQNEMTLIPFGMEHIKAIEIIANQVENIPKDVKRVVVPVGGGVTLCGVLCGLRKFERYDVEVLGVMTGKQPDKLLRSLQPIHGMPYELVPYKADVSPLDMYSMKTDYSIDGIKLDPIYEGKCYPFLRDGDLLWIVGYHEVN